MAHFVVEQISGLELSGKTLEMRKTAAGFELSLSNQLVARCHNDSTLINWALHDRRAQRVVEQPRPDFSYRDES